MTFSLDLVGYSGYGTNRLFQCPRCGNLEVDIAYPDSYCKVFRFYCKVCKNKWMSR